MKYAALLDDVELDNGPAFWAIRSPKGACPPQILGISSYFSPRSPGQIHSVLLRTKRRHRQEATAASDFINWVRGWIFSPKQRNVCTSVSVVDLVPSRTSPRFLGSSSDHPEAA